MIRQKIADNGIIDGASQQQGIAEVLFRTTLPVVTGTVLYPLVAF